MATSPLPKYRSGSSRIATLFLLAGLACSADLPLPACASELEIGRIREDKLDEISGIVVGRRNSKLLWVHNDGSSDRIYGISRKGKVRVWIDCKREIEDAEDIAIGPGPKDGADYLYLGDIGDNDLRRIEIRVVRIREPKVSKSQEGRIKTDKIEEFRLMYPDRPHDAETLLVDPLTGELLIITKDPHQARVFTIASDQLVEGGVAVLRFAGSLPMEKVTGGDISADGSQIVLRSNELGWWWPRHGKEPVARTLVRPARIIRVRGEGQDTQGEAIGLVPDGSAYITVSEGEFQPIYEFDLEVSVPAGW